MDDKQRAANNPGGSDHGGGITTGDDHYQPWLRNGDTPGAAGAAPRPAPLPTRPTAIIERADDPAPPMRSAHLSADELLARPIPFTEPAPGTLGLIDRLSQGIADGSQAVRGAWQQGGLGEAVARLELGRRARQGGAALASASRSAIAWAGEASHKTGEALAPVIAKAGEATGTGLKRVGAGLADGSRKLAGATRDATGSVMDAIAARTGGEPPQPESQLDRLIAGDDAVAAAVAPPSAAALPLFAAPTDDIEPEAPQRKGRKPAASAQPVASAAASTIDFGGDDRSPAPPPAPARALGPSGAGGGNRGGGGGGISSGGLDRPWLRHPATLALGGAFLVAAGFAAGLYWTGPGVDRASTERVVHDYLLNNPEILPQAMARLQANQAAVAVNRLRDRIETPFSGAWAGAADGDVVLTMFTDYACTYCRASLADVERLLGEDRRLKVVFRELPILSPDSEAAARLALAAARRGRYMPMHRALFASRTPDAAARAAAADSMGIGAGSAVTGTQQIDDELEKNIALARELGFDGTPSWVVGDRMLTGAVGYQQLKDAVAAAREG